MLRTLRRLARIQRLQQDEARNRLLTAEQAFDAHATELKACEQARLDTLEAEPESADERMRRHSYSLRQEMQRRRLTARAEELEGAMEDRRGDLLEAAKKVEQTERFTDRVAATLEDAMTARAQRELDEVGLLAWSRKHGGLA